MTGKISDCFIGLLPRKGRTKSLILVMSLLAPRIASAADLLEAFVPINGKCHWTRINSEMGSVVSAWPVDSPKCPTHANRTKATDGTQLFAVTFRENGRTALWQLRKDAKSLDVLPKITELELGWKEADSLRALTTTAQAFTDGSASKEVEAKLTEEEIADLEEDQWTAPCFFYLLKGDAWYILAPTTDAIAHEIIEPSYSKGGIHEHQQTHPPTQEKTRRI